MCRNLDVYAKHRGEGERRPEAYWHAFEAIHLAYHDDCETAFAYVMLGAARSDDASFLASLACGPLEDVLRDPSDALLDRIVREARKSARFRWLLSHPFKTAIARRAWDAISEFRVYGPHQEPPSDGMPPRDQAHSQPLK
ncbi:DUF6869 domain-containing protein [Novosphingobium pokkalii]